MSKHVFIEMFLTEEEADWLLDVMRMRQYVQYEPERAKKVCEALKAALGLE